MATAKKPELSQTLQERGCREYRDSRTTIKIEKGKTGPGTVWPDRSGHTGLEVVLQTHLDPVRRVLIRLSDCRCRRSQQ